MAEEPTPAEIPVSNQDNMTALEKVDKLGAEIHFMSAELSTLSQDLEQKLAQFESALKEARHQSLVRETH